MMHPLFARHAVQIPRARSTLRTIAWAVLAALVSLAPMAWRSVPAYAQTTILAAGYPPLTVQTVDTVNTFLEWVLDAPLSAAQRLEVRDSLIASWRRGDAEAMATVAQIIGLQTQVEQAGETQRALARAQIQPVILDSAHQQPNDPVSGVMLAAYEAAHRPIAPGDPPLTRQVADAYTETMVFVLQVVATGDGWAVNKDVDTWFKDAMAEGLAANYPAYGAAQRQALAQMPVYRAAIHEAWPSLPAAERTQLRDQWRPIAQGMLAQVNCEAFDGLSSGNFVENTPENVAHLRRCWEEQPDLPGARETAAARAASAAQAPAAQSPAPPSYGSHSSYVAMTNMLTTQYAASMNAIFTMGGSSYHYEVK
jgi:hypothetical protein